MLNNTITSLETNSSCVWEVDYSNPEWVDTWNAMTTEEKETAIYTIQMNNHTSIQVDITRTGDIDTAATIEVRRHLPH